MSAGVALELVERGAHTLLSDYFCLQPGEQVLITADTATDRAAVDAVFRAARTLGAHPSLLLMPQVPFQGGLADPYVPQTLGPASRNCDVWIDLTFPYLAGSHVYEEAIKAGRVRYLLGGDTGSGGLARMFGSVDLDAYFSVLEKLQGFIGESVGKRARITCPLGTDIEFELDKVGIPKPRLANKPGMFLVPGSCGLFPVLESVKGKMAFTAIFHEYFCKLEQPLVVTVDGKVRQVEGPTNHRLTLERALRRAGNGEFGNIIHFTYAMNPGARETAQGFIEGSRVMGSNAVGMGLPWWVPGGGENHPDGVLSNQSIWIDGEAIVKDGVIVGPAEVRDIADRLQPRVGP